MVYSRMGIGGVILIIVVASARIYNAIDRYQPSHPPQAPPSINSPLHPDYAENQTQKMLAQIEQQNRDRAAMNRQWLDQQDAQFNAITQQSQQRMQQQIERDRQRQAELREQLQQARTPPALAPPTYRPTVTTTPSQPTYRPPTPSPTPTPVTPAQPAPSPEVAVAPVVKVIEPFEYSPEPSQEILKRYGTWKSDGQYDRFLGAAYEFGDWRFKPSTEFEFQRNNSRTAKWGVGKAGLGMDVDLFKLYPRDQGMTCPVFEDTESMQEFRLGRRVIRAKGNAQVSHMQTNGLMIWRVHTPARQGESFGSCYYMTIIGKEDAILFTCRYDANKPEQIAAFDAVVQTLEYAKAD